MKPIFQQFFTKNNPFISDAFNEWIIQIPIDTIIVEPFAGECHLGTYLSNYKFDYFDIDPKHENIIKNDSIINFPTGYKVAITNPPYLGKSSAKRNNQSYNYSHQDLYLASLEQILNHTEYSAVIIPASFLANNYFKDRLAYVDIKNEKLFTDTDIPVIVAYFVNKQQNNYKLYKNGKFVSVINEYKLPKNNNYKIEFNNNDGNLGLYAIDGTSGTRIRFCKASEIDRPTKSSDRAITKIKINIPITDSIINKLNYSLENYRNSTFDTTLTAFRGLQKNGDHRKRISYKLVKEIIWSLNL